ncbi:Hypothetical protein, putative [Bodo saltans]|uniref:Uncharacterized protein n=1 Tax=Bodo saltans TaxID=75058 RepID=A0A0S4J398_BODSA|nr:Hypothetical protein, putative [Bodo saltans]|eukprot:CUG65751.1 Hypothetical protein, putative [Bodo saltans]
MESTLAALPYDRTLLNQVRSGKGKGVKKLRDEIQSNPAITQQFFKERGIEIENGKQREKMMWVKDANSRVRRVESDGRDACVYTNPMNVHSVPNRASVAAAKSKRNDTTSSCNGMSLFN